MAMRVLVVDDEQMICESLCLLLEDSGFDVCTALDARAAFEHLHHGAFDAAIVDLRLPEMDGETFVQRAHRIQPGMHFLIHTGSSEYSPSPALERLGVRGEHVIHKPVPNIGVIVEALRDLQAG